MSFQGTYNSTSTVNNVDHFNLDQNIIHITEDKLKIAINDHLKNIENKTTWYTPFGILLAVIPLFTTSDFKENFIFSADTWRAFFLFVMIAAAIWFIVSFYKACRAPSVEDLIKKIKNS